MFTCFSVVVLCVYMSTQVVFFAQKNDKNAESPVNSISLHVVARSLHVVARSLHVTFHTVLQGVFSCFLSKKHGIKPFFDELYVK